MSITTDTPEVIRIQEASIAGVPFRVEGPVRRALISIIPGKLVIGDATRGDSQLSSSWTLPDASGGLLVEKAKPSEDLNRGWMSTSETRYVDSISLPPYVQPIEKPTTGGESPEPLNNPSVIFGLGTKTYAAFGLALKEWNETDQTWDDPGGSAVTLPHAATDTRFFAGRQWIACGDAHPVQAFSGTSVTSVVAGEDDFEATHLCPLDTKIYGMKSDGSMRSAVDTGTFTLDTEGGLGWAVQSGTIARLDIFRDLNGSPVLYAATTTGLWYYDANGELWRQSQVKIPHHRYGGRGTVPWRSEMFFAAGISVLKFNLSTASSVGLDRDNGLPSDLDGHISTMVGGLNWLYAFVRSREISSGDPDPIYTGSPIGDSDIFPSGQSFSTLWASDGNGIWARLWTSTSTTGTISAAAVAASGDDTYLWWSADSRVYRMLLPSGIHNPEKNPTAQFQRRSWHITPWFDADWSEELKMAIMLRLGVKGLSATERIRVQVGFDDDEGFATDLGWVTASTLASPTGVVAFEFGSGFGRPFYRIRFRFELERGDDRRKTPQIRFIALNYLKGIDNVYGYDLTVDLSEEYHGRSPEEMRAALEDVCGSKVLVPFRYKDAAGHPRVRAVRVNRYFDAESTGFDDRGKVQISLSEVYAH